VKLSVYMLSIYAINEANTDHRDFFNYFSVVVLSLHVCGGCCYRLRAVRYFRAFRGEVQ
jgi:hypothetical protein